MGKWWQSDSKQNVGKVIRTMPHLFLPRGFGSHPSPSPKVKRYPSLCERRGFHQLQAITLPSFCVQNEESEKSEQVANVIDEDQREGGVKVFLATSR